MSERDSDPIANTQMFRAFVERGEAEAPGRRRPSVVTISLIVLAVVVVAGLVAWLIAG
jgi:hypothetical protein